MCHTRYSYNWRAGSEWNCSSFLILFASCQQTSMTYTYHWCVYSTVKNSWWWTEELSEICTVSFQKQIWEISASIWFYYKNKKLTKYFEINSTCFGVLAIKCYKNVLRGSAMPACLFTSASTTREHLIGSSENFTWDSCIKIYRNIQNVLNLGTKNRHFSLKPTSVSVRVWSVICLFLDSCRQDWKCIEKVEVKYNSRKYSVCYLQFFSFNFMVFEIIRHNWANQTELLRYIHISTRT